MPNHWFFFSYSHETHKNARWSKLDKEGNFLEAFFEELCRQVSNLTGESAENVAYRDQDRLRIGDVWSPNLIEGLQQSRVLVSILSPQYMNSESCGREVESFRRRLKKLQESSRYPNASPRIIPIFWIDSLACLRNLNPDVVRFIKTLQLSQKGAPEGYPTKGLSQYYCLSQHESYSQLCLLLASRIVELGAQEALPLLSDEEYDFNKLPSAFLSHAEKQHSLIAEGPNGTNVFYAVGTSEDMRLIGYPDGCIYGEKPQDWEPFTEHPGATIEIITREGLNAAGQKTYYDLGLPQDLLDGIEKAKHRNSPVLIILDRRALQLDRFKNAFRKYDEHNYYHVGLVAGGGADISDEVLAASCMFKFPRVEDQHVWEAPRDRSSYVLSVKEVVRSIRQKLQRTGTPVIEVSPRRKPGLNARFGM